MQRAAARRTAHLRAARRSGYRRAGSTTCPGSRLLAELVLSLLTKATGRPRSGTSRSGPASRSADTRVALERVGWRARARRKTKQARPWYAAPLQRGRACLPTEDRGVPDPDVRRDRSSPTRICASCWPTGPARPGLHDRVSRATPHVRKLEAHRHGTLGRRRGDAVGPLTVVERRALDKAVERFGRYLGQQASLAVRPAI